MGYHSALLCRTWELRARHGQLWPNTPLTSCEGKYAFSQSLCPETFSFVVTHKHFKLSVEWLKDVHQHWILRGSGGVKNGRYKRSYAADHPSPW